MSYGAGSGKKIVGAEAAPKADGSETKRSCKSAQNATCWFGSTICFKKTEAKHLARQGFCPPIRRPLPCLLIKSFFYDSYTQHM